jgi:hypothetical protein
MEEVAVMSATIIWYMWLRNSVGIIRPTPQWDFGTTYPVGFYEMETARASVTQTCEFGVAPRPYEFGRGEEHVPPNCTLESMWLSLAGIRQNFLLIRQGWRGRMMVLLWDAHSLSLTLATRWVDRNLRHQVRACCTDSSVF